MATPGAYTSQQTESDALAVLMAESEIRRQLHAYCRAVLALDAQRLADVWHADGTLDYEQDAVQGPVSELAGALLEEYRPLQAHSHQVTNTVIAVDGDRAASETYAMESLRAYPDASGGFVVDHRRSRYLDRWSRRDGRWAIDHRDALLTFAWKETVAAGRANTRPSSLRDDPSDELFATVGEPPTMNGLGREWLSERAKEGGERERAE